MWQNKTLPSTTAGGSHRPHAARPPASGSSRTPGVEIYAKLESRNPGGSVKDRAALGDHPRRRAIGALRRGRVLLDATSGNTGIAYAMLGASRGYRVRLCVPANVTPERKRLLARLRRGPRASPIRWKAATARSARRGASRGRRARSVLLRGSVQQRRQLARALRHDRAPRSSSRPAAASRISSPGSARAARSSAPAAGCASIDASIHAGLGAARLAAARPRRTQAHGDGHRAADLRSARWPIDNLTVVDRDGARAHAGGSRARRACSSGRRAARRWRLPARWPPASTPASSSRSFRTAAIATCREPFWDGDAGARAPNTGQPGRLHRPRRRAAIRARRRVSYPDECCGALFGPADGACVEALPLDNVTTEERQRRFLVGPDEYRAAEQHADARGRALSASIIRIRIIRPSPRRSIWSTRGRT